MIHLVVVPLGHDPHITGSQVVSFLQVYFSTAGDPPGFSQVGRYTTWWSKVAQACDFTNIWICLNCVANNIDFNPKFC
jgi:hypothetical protein